MRFSTPQKSHRSSIGRSTSASKYLPQSHYHPGGNPQVLSSFFHNHPFEKVETDKKHLRPVMYECPPNVANRSYVIVDTKVRRDAPISKEQLQHILRSHQANHQPQIVTYGIQNQHHQQRHHQQRHHQQKRHIDHHEQSIKIDKHKRQSIHTVIQGRNQSKWCLCGGDNQQPRHLKVEDNWRRK